MRALDPKPRDLAYLAVLAAARMDSGVAFHVREAKRHGASRDEVVRLKESDSRVDAAHMAIEGRSRRALSRWWLADLVCLAVATYLIGRYAHAFTGFPKGYDAWGHLSKARMIADNWPHVNWNDEWYAGQPSFQGSYPPGYHLLVVALAALAHCGLATAMVAIAAAATIAGVAGLYGFVTATSGSRTAGLVSAGLVLGTATFWDQIVELGLYPRLVAFDVALVAVAAAALHRRTGRKASLLVTAVALSASLSIHPVSGGIGVLLVALVLLAPGAGPNPSRRLVQTLGVTVGAFALSGYFYVPLLLQRRSQSAFTDTEQPLRLPSLLLPTHGDLAALQPVLLPGVALLAIGVALVLRRKPPPFREVIRLGTRLPLLVTRPAPGEPVPADLDESARRYVLRHWEWAARLARHRRSVVIAAGLLVGTLGSLAYCLVGYVWPHFPLYVNGLQPRDMLVFPAVLLAAAVGLGVAVVADCTRRAAGIGLRGLALAAAAGIVAIAVPMLPAGVKDASSDATPAIAALLPPDARTSTDYRISGTTDGTTRFIDALTDTAQTRGYDDHGNLHLDWQYWLEHAFSDPSFTRDERAWLARWYAVKWLYSDDTGRPGSVLAGDPAYTKLGEEHVYSDVTLWQAAQPAPIATAVNAPTVLVIGDATHYDLVLRALAAGDVDDRSVVPVQGPARLDDLTAGELSGFDTVLLYGAAVGRPAYDAALLRDYLARGGGVVVEDGDGSAAARLVAAGAPLPVRGERVRPVLRSWPLRPGSDPLAGGADVADWAPAVYGRAMPWDVREATALQGWAWPVLSAPGGPAVAAGGVGAGEVVWSGLNLPYHAAAYHNAAEGRFLGAMLRRVSRPVAATAAGAPSDHRVDPEQRVVLAPAGTAGVLVREYLAPDWHVTVDGKAARIWPAGPGMMYVALSASATAPVRVVLRYRLGGVEWLGIALSVLTGLAVLLWCLPGPVRRVRRRCADALATRVAALFGFGPLDIPAVRRPAAAAAGPREREPAGR